MVLHIQQEVLLNITTGFSATTVVTVVIILKPEQILELQKITVTINKSDVRALRLFGCVSVVEGSYTILFHFCRGFTKGFPSFTCQQTEKSYVPELCLTKPKNMCSTNVASIDDHGDIPICVHLVKNLASKSAAVIFTKSSCCMCHSIKALFYELGASPAIHEVDNDADMEWALRLLGSNPATPAVFIGGKYIGSAKDVITLHVDGSLKQKLIEARAIWF
ncbi:glutaredoxin-C11-like protein [Tanacetum coccineum]